MSHVTYKYEVGNRKDEKDISFETFLRIAEMKKYRKMLEKRIKAQNVKQR